MNDLVIREEVRAPLTVREMVAQVQTIQQVMKSIMIEGIHYGKIPGTQSNTLFKAGAETLACTFRIAPQYAVEDLSPSSDEIRYRVKCTGVHQLTGVELGQGMGEASSNEEKYKWKRSGSKREFESTLPDRRRVKYGYSKADRKEFEIQQVRVEPADISNTVLKMACKRAEVAMVLTVLAAGDIFSQDLEDVNEDLRENVVGQPVEAAREVRQPESKPATVDRDTGEVTRDLKNGPMTEVQKKILRAKMEQKNVDASEIMTRFGVELEKLPFGMFGEVQSFITGEAEKV